MPACCSCGDKALLLLLPLLLSVFSFRGSLIGNYWEDKKMEKA
jgi:hypothetical protein